MTELAFVFAGLLVGFIVGMTGVGGGSLMTPILIFFFGIKPYLAVGTDLLFAAFTKLGGTVQLARQRIVPWRVVAQLSAGSIPAAFVTLWALRHAGANTDAVQSTMTFGLGLALLLTAAATLYKAIKQGKRTTASPGQALTESNPSYAKSINAEHQATRARHWSLPIVFGALIGCLVTLTSVGAGAIGVTVLMFLFPLLPLQRIVAADIAYAVPLTLVAGLGHAGMGSVDWRMLFFLLTGSLPGIWLGTRVGQQAPERVIRALLSVLLAYTGIKLVAL